MVFSYINLQNQGCPKFSKNIGNELWVMLLEKAYAKMFGSCEKIEGGLTGKAIRDLTGAPYESLSHDEMSC